nr:protein O-linked-mannose beta-1,4-N-acetylglucosaminyltransferase 2-like [Ipomoea batatas]
MQDPVLAKSFSRNERKRFGYGGLVLIVIIILSSCMVFKPHLHPLFMIEEVMNLQLSITATQDLLVLNDTTFPRAMAKEEKEVKPICNVLEARSDYCEMKGDIRVVGNSSTIFLVTHHDLNNNNISRRNSWTLKPYPRKDSAAAMAQVKNWTVKLVQETSEIPKCGVFHGYPAVLFSQGGFSGNHFHDFTDLLIPIFAASQHFNGEVHFLATDFRKWWTGKYRMVLGGLSKHQVTDIDKDHVVQCFPSMTVGLKSHTNKELGIDSSKFPNKVSMKHFKHFLRATFSLPRTQAIRLGSGSPKRPRLMIISRNKTRVLMNEDEVLEMAEKVGYKVVKAEASISTNLSRFAGVVNSCDVLMGVHGAGLTNMVFLPDNGVVIQVIPLGEIDGFGRRDFGYPSRDLNVKYLEYKIGVNESSLVDSYPLDHAVFKDPKSIHRKGWMALRSIYLDQQNVRIDVNRFRDTLIQALTLLQH